jgi:hypothetical protein
MTKTYCIAYWLIFVCLDARSGAPWRPWEGCGRHGWHVCICLTLASFYLGICVTGVHQPNTQPTTNNLANLIS